MIFFISWSSKSIAFAEVYDFPHNDSFKILFLGYVWIHLCVGMCMCEKVPMAASGI